MRRRSLGRLAVEDDDVGAPVSCCSSVPWLRYCSWATTPFRHDLVCSHTLGFDGGRQRQGSDALPQPSLSTATDKAASGCIRVRLGRFFGHSARKDPEALINRQCSRATVSRSTSSSPAEPVVERFCVRRYLGQVCRPPSSRCRKRWRSNRRPAQQGTTWPGSASAVAPPALWPHQIST
jgi:hypothetical protein